MAAPVKTTLTELPESRVRVLAEVGAEEVERRVQETARTLGRDLKIPGFRKGKVPPPVVIRRVGRETVLDETVRDTLGRWYVDAVDASGIVPVGDPELDIGVLPAQGEGLSFTIEIGVRPSARLGRYRGVQAPRREPAADPEAAESELQTLRERSARLEAIDRPAASGDFVVMDYVGAIDGVPFPGGEGRDQLLELGSGRLIPGFEEGLTGASAGERRTVELTFPDDYGAEHLAGRAASFDVTVKEVQAKLLPDLDDDFATETAGFDTIAELREDIAARLRVADERRVDNEFREAALDAAVDDAQVEVPAALARARAGEMWERTMHSLSHQGVTKEAYLQMAGRSEEDIVAEVVPDAERTLRREAVVAAIVAAEHIEPDEPALLEALASAAEREESTPEKMLARLRKTRHADALIEDVAAQQAVELVASEAQAIPVAQTQAREKLWTPDQEPAAEASSEDPASPAAQGLWTPGG